jgi:enoyl-CoA hydratase/carnithine racemase
MSDVLTVTTEGHVAHVTLSRPDKHNAVNLEMFEALGDAGEHLGKDRSIRAVVLSGAGGNFCSGIDTSIFGAAEPAINVRLMAPGESTPANFFQRAAYTWRELPVPVICAIHGVAYGAGFQFAMAADLRYAAPDARLSIMEIKWGLIPDLAISTSLRDVLPVDKAKELTWTGRIVNAAEALELGLLTALHDDPVAAALEMAAELSIRSPDAIRSAKTLFNRAWRMSEAQALALEAELQTAILGSANQAEAVLANIERRAPVFED